MWVLSISDCTLCDVNTDVCVSEYINIGACCMWMTGWVNLTLGCDLVASQWWRMSFDSIKASWHQHHIRGKLVGYGHHHGSEEEERKQHAVNRMLHRTSHSFKPCGLAEISTYKKLCFQQVFTICEKMRTWNGEYNVIMWERKSLWDWLDIGTDWKRLLIVINRI